MFTELLLQSAKVSAYNPLVVALALLGAGGAVSATFLFRSARGEVTQADRDSFAWLFALLGFFALLVSGEIFWADWAGFPAQQYTELFGVAQTLWAATLLAASFVVHRDLDPRPFGWLTAVSGLVLLQGGRAILAFSLTRGPTVSAAIWFCAGLAGLLVLPASYAAEESPARTYLLYAAAALVAVMAVLGTFMAVEAHFGHIAEVAAAG